MGDSEPLNIRVIYTANARERKRIKKSTEREKSTQTDVVQLAEPQTDAYERPTIAVDLSGSSLVRGVDLTGSSPVRGAAVSIQPAKAPTASRRLLALGLVHLLAAAALYYATWWPCRSYISIDVLFFKTPLPIAAHELDRAASQLFGTKPGVGAAYDTAREPRFVGDTARAIIGLTAYGWLTLSTCAACAVALAAGFNFNRFLSKAWRIVAIVGFLLLVGTLIWGAYATWSEYKRMVPPDRVRLAIAGLAFLCCLGGAAWGKRPKKINALAGCMVLFAACASIAGLLLLAECDAVIPEHTSVPFLAAVFGIHSCYGWFLLIASRRIGS